MGQSPSLPFFLSHRRFILISPLCLALSLLHSPIIGGFLSNPSENFTFFEHNKFFLAYPYALPCFAAASFPFLGALLGALLLDESLPSKTNQKKKERRDRDEEVSIISSTIPSLSSTTTTSPTIVESQEPPPPFSDLFIRPVFACLTVYVCFPSPFPSLLS